MLSKYSASLSEPSEASNKKSYGDSDKEDSRYGSLLRTASTNYITAIPTTTAVNDEDDV
jgi:hypothetical protein